MMLHLDTCGGHHIMVHGYTSGGDRTSCSLRDVLKLFSICFSHGVNSRGGDRDWCNDAVTKTGVMNVSLTRAQSASRIHYTSRGHHIIHVLGAQG